uniref:Uncharacterized protein n=1 Tax=viral metagenome TaxID=1070528 RepID=A0A6M3LK21_9ZZZZ
MAMSGKKDPSMGVIRVGASRGEIELTLGQPFQVSSAQEETICIYQYEIGNEPSAGRAIFHGLMDLMTFGFWEIIGTPVEGLQGKKYQVIIHYNRKDVVTKISQ